MTNNTTPTVLAEPENRLPDFAFHQLPEPLASNVAAMGWKHPMPVQVKAVPYLLSGRDMIVQSHTGSGKTGAFLIPLLQRLDPNLRSPQALILVPTRELAMQVYEEFVALSEGTGLRGALIYGGVGYGPQLQALRDGAQVIIGTPGRITDHLGRRSLNFNNLRVLVFDEADEMLSMGFYPAMIEIRSWLPRKRISWMFSATMPYKVQLLAEEFLTKPEFLTLSAGHETVSTMEHRWYMVPPMDKDLMLMRLIELENPESAIIFCNMKSDVEYVAGALRSRGYNADLLSGDLSQKERETAMRRIKNHEVRFLVATDVAARGIDISDLAYVFQYDVPKDSESYLHRAGRTARAGNTGVVVTLVANMADKTDLNKIARRYSVDFVEMKLPTQEEMEQRIAERLINLLEERMRKITKQVHRERIARFESLVKGLAQTEDEWMLVAMLFDEIYQHEFHAAAVTAGPKSKHSGAATPMVTPSATPPPQQASASHKGGTPPQTAASHKPERAQQPEQQQFSATADLSAQPQDVPQEPAKKKKKKKKRRRNRGAEQSAASTTLQEIGSDAAASIADSITDSATHPTEQQDVTEMEVAQPEITAEAAQAAKPATPAAKQKTPRRKATRGAAAEPASEPTAAPADVAATPDIVPEIAATTAPTEQPKKASAKRGAKPTNTTVQAESTPAEVTPAAAKQARRKKGAKPAELAEPPATEANAEPTPATPKPTRKTGAKKASKEAPASEPVQEAAPKPKRRKKE
ncbi:MAG: DEAD/DEAH box helicase [Chlorobi bacterium]|nr:DEAD/DEAH box helicase [Chlorobiota bacterium]